MSEPDQSPDWHNWTADELAANLELEKATTGPDITLDITNGKKLTINLSPFEWILILTSVITIVVITGVTF